jgi:uncharacterized protein YgiM (DUF1202 family)
MSSRRGLRYALLAALLILLYACNTSQKADVAKQPSSATTTAVSRVESADEQAPAVAPTPEPTPDAVIMGSVTARSNVRNKPTTEGSTIIGKVNPGESFTVVGRVEDSSWYTVETSSGTKGWIRADLVSADPALTSALPVTPSDVIANTPPIEGPADAPTGALSAEGRRYMLAALAPIQRYTEALFTLSSVSREAGETPLLLQDQDWKIKAAVAAVLLKDAGKELGNLPSPPPEFQAIDGYFKEISTETALLDQEFQFGVDNVDADALESAVGRIQRVTALINTIQQELTKLDL